MQAETCDVCAGQGYWEGPEESGETEIWVCRHCGVYTPVLEAVRALQRQIGADAMIDLLDPAHGLTTLELLAVQDVLNEAIMAEDAA